MKHSDSSHTVRRIFAAGLYVTKAGRTFRLVNPETFETREEAEAWSKRDRVNRFLYCQPEPTRYQFWEAEVSPRQHIAAM